MRASFKLLNPDQMEASMTLTMKLKEWKKLRDTLPNEWPAWDLGNHIRDIILQAEKSFYSEDKES